jgi:hypothetical protein
LSQVGSICLFDRPKSSEDYSGGALPTIAPPPAPIHAAFNDTSPRFNPFDQQNELNEATVTQQESAIPFGKIIYTKLPQTFELFLRWS